MSVALANDGTTGMLIELGRQIYTFDITSATMRPTGIKGAWPIRYSSDAHYVGCRSDNSGMKEYLRVIDAQHMTLKDLGQYSYIGNIRPTAGGSFLVTAEIGGAIKNGTVGQLCNPATGQITEIWRASASNEPGPERRTDFDPETMLGVSTDFRLVTSLIDLKTGAVPVTIDNSANYKPTIVSWTPRHMTGWELSNWLLLRGVIAFGVLACIVLVATRLKSRRQTGNGFVAGEAVGREEA